MGDYQDFCESYGGCASDPNFMDEWIQKYLCNEENSNKESSSDTLPKGKLVHIIKLKGYHPAKPVGIIWNKKLNNNLPCKGANHLNSTDHDEPASWFVRNGFIVRSSKNNGYWYQIVFKKSNKETCLEQDKIKEYEAICSTLNSDWVVNRCD